MIGIVGLAIRDGAGQALVEGVDLRIARGEAVAVIGATGSGKTLIAQALLGLLPDGFQVEGMLDLGDERVPLEDRARVRRLWSRGTTLLPQEPRTALDPTMRVGRQLAAAAALDAVDLPASAGRAYPYALSGGMAQRVLVATVLDTEAPLVVVDEPTKGLDDARVGQVLMLLRGLLGRGRCLLVITHDAGLARGLGGAVAVLRGGRVVEYRPASALFARPLHAYTRDWLEADPARWPAFPPARPAGAVAVAESVGFAYPGQKPLFRGVELVVHRGGVVALTGPSGAGKSTLGDVIVGLRRPDSGRMLWQGADPHADARLRRRLRRRFQKLHQDARASFLPHRPLRRQFQHLVEVLPGLDLSAALPPLLDRLSLSADLLDRFPDELSGGEAQRLALVRLLLLEPLLIVADEPTSRLDPITQRATIRLLRDVARERAIGLVLISHNQVLVSQAADTVVSLPGGQAFSSGALSR